MTHVVVADAEDAVKAWLLTTSVAPLITWAGKTHVYLAMPTGSPTPSVVLSRAGGAPASGSDTSEDVARISFRVYAKDRSAAKDIAKALVSEIENIAYSEVVVTVSGRIDAAETRSWVWSQDPTSQTPRYLIDAVFIVRS